jgi:hypothetical protein
VERCTARSLRRCDHDDEEVVVVVVVALKLEEVRPIARVRRWWRQSLKRRGRLHAAVVGGEESRGEELEEATIIGGGEAMADSWLGSQKIWEEYTGREEIYIVLKNINHDSS